MCGVLLCTHTQLHHFTRSQAFFVAMPTLWNTLPDNILSVNNVITVRCHLKTYLFNLA